MFNQTDIVLTAVGDIFDGHISNFAGAIGIGTAFDRYVDYVYISESDDTHIVYENIIGANKEVFRIGGIR